MNFIEIPPSGNDEKGVLINLDNILSVESERGIIHITYMNINKYYNITYDEFKKLIGINKKEML